VAAPSIKDQILEISEDYLGPAAERFIDRQISTHLRKSPNALTAKDLYLLIDWLKLSLSLITKDTALVEEYTQRLGLVASGKGEAALGSKWQKT
jgi:hypothetical protein